MEAVRLATTADGPELERLALHAGEELAAERDGPMYLLADDPPWPTVNGDAARLTWVGTLDGTPVGFLTARRQLLAGGQCLAVIDALFVEPAARQVSVGELLVEAVVAWAEEAGAVGIDAFALPGARGTKNFFEANGFKARAITVHRPLAAHPGRGTRATGLGRS